MGKKEGKKRPIADIEEDIEDEEDAELQAELAALEAMKTEQDPQESVNHQGKSYNKEALMQYVDTLENMSLPFVETMQISRFDVHVTDENDDLEREMAFYNHALQAVEYGRNQLTALGVPHKRPEDYFAESIKSDAHMARIKDKLILEEKKIDAFEQRKQRELNRKYNKQVSAMRKEEKSKATKSEIEAGKQMRADDDEDSKSTLSRKGVRDGVKSARRIGLDKKYSAGGREKKRAKLNDKKSLNDFSDYSPRGGKLIRREKGGGGHGKMGGGGGAKKGGNRPGKANRDAKRKSRK